MKKLGSIAVSVMMMFSLFGSFVTPSMAQPAPTSAPDNIPGRQPPERVQELPAEVVDMFTGGMPLDKFLSLNQGPVPKALRELTDQRVTVIVELQQAPLAELYAAELAENSLMSATSQQAHLESLEDAQAAVVTSLESLGGRVIDQYTKAYNGILVQLPADQLDSVREDSGVKAVHRAPEHVPSLSNSVPLINATDVIDTLGYDGTGTTIAVIDTGIDYYHAAFGGSGNPADYTSDDPDVIEGATFPTAKVIGGYDFAGTLYDAGCTAQEEADGFCQSFPTPDPDPLDENGHGTHVASIAAGAEVTGQVGHGVAPGAELYALKVFGKSGSTNVTVSAIEWAMDPNADGDLSDHVDVINMSLGSLFGPATNSDPDVVASNNASNIGIVVAAASGNEGNSSYVTSTPAAASAAISVAASTTGFLTGPTISVDDVTVVYQPPAFDENTGHFNVGVTAPLYYVGANEAVNSDELCDLEGWDENALSGDLALIQRGTCAFSTKVNNAAALGAVGAIIFNHETGGNSRSTMIGDPVDIPAGFVAHDDGLILSAHHGASATVSAENDVQAIEDAYTPADSIASFSSRGPRGFDSFLKPEITAPGAAIFAASMGHGTEGSSLSGTSMATPHIAGVAGLLSQAHSDWTPEQMKAAMMNTAVDLVDEVSREVPRQGAGRVDALGSATTTSIAVGDPELVSLSWGVVPITDDYFVGNKTITLQNFDTVSKTYTVDWGFAPGSFEAGFELTLPMTVEVDPAPGFAYVSVDLTVDATQIPVGFQQLEEYYGYVTFTNTGDETDVLRVPFYVVPQAYSDLDPDNLNLEGIFGSVELQHTGPVSSSVWAYPLYAMDANEPAQGDEGDLRMVGMDFGFTSGTYGDIFIPAINVYGSWHDPQPFFAEFDLWMDVDQDGANDFVDFNYNLGWLLGSDQNNVWVVIQVDLNAGSVFLGSPFAIFTDFNTGYMEWYLPAAWHGLDENDQDFNYRVDGTDLNYFNGGSVDSTAVLYFDIARPPFDWSLDANPGPADPSETMTFGVNDASGYADMNPLGLMIVDYNGVPGQGQAHAVTFLVEKPFTVNLPIIKN